MALVRGPVVEVVVAGRAVGVRRSTMGGRPCVWLSVPGVPSEIGPATLVARLTLADARRVRDALDAFLREHE